MLKDSVPVHRSLVGHDQKWRVGTELTTEEVYAIGYATVMWAYLEHALLIRTAITANRANIPIPKDAENPSFTRRLNAWRLLIEETVSDARERGSLLRLVSRIANAEQDRHKLSHGLWDFDPAKPDRSRVASFRPSFEYNEAFDYSKMCKHCDRLGRINAELTFPDGDPSKLDPELEPDDATDEKTPVAFVSRSFLLNPSLSDPADPRLQQAMPPEARPLRSPSPE